MKRIIQAAFVLGAVSLIALVPWSSARQPALGHPYCEDNAPLCTETIDPYNYEGNYTGHDEPSVLFYSSTAGSGSNQVYRLTLPNDPPNPPKQDGSGGTFNFQLHPAFWFGLAMCDDQSAPNPGGSTLAGANVGCTPDSDANIYTGTTPTSLGGTNYIGQHPGTAFMEMQFYAPGWIQWPPGDSCDPTKWCAALNVDSFSENLNISGAGGINNADCLGKAGVEPVNFAFITRNGKSTGPANPLDANAATFTPDPSKDLMMHSGDTLIVSMHDTADGFEVVITDLTTGQSGSMKASVANGFGQVNYDPSATTCTLTKAPFHPSYSTSSEDTRVVWAAHSYNVAFSDEIGHFEYCKAATGLGGDCTQDGVGDADTTLSGAEDDVYCFVPPFGAPVQATRVKIGGCFGTDADFDGVPYQPVWPGSTTNSALETGYHPTSILFTSPTFNSGATYSRLAFEADLPRIEFDTNPTCNRSSGANCVYPPVGANFYPIYSTGSSGGQCVWQLGGQHIPGTTNTYGYGPLLQLVYPSPTGTFLRYNNFRNVLGSNPC